MGGTWKLSSCSTLLQMGFVPLLRISSLLGVSLVSWL